MSVFRRELALGCALSVLLSLPHLTRTWVSLPLFFHPTLFASSQHLTTITPSPLPFPEGSLAGKLTAPSVHTQVLVSGSFGSRHVPEERPSRTCPQTRAGDARRDAPSPGGPGAVRGAVHAAPRFFLPSPRGRTPLRPAGLPTQRLPGAPLPQGEAGPLPCWQRSPS